MLLPYKSQFSNKTIFWKYKNNWFISMKCIKVLNDMKALELRKRSIVNGIKWKKKILIIEHNINAFSYEGEKQLICWKKAFQSIVTSSITTRHTEGQILAKQHITWYSCAPAEYSDGILKHGLWCCILDKVDFVCVWSGVEWSVAVVDVDCFIQIATPTASTWNVSFLER